MLSFARGVCGTSSGLGPGQGTGAPIPGPKHGGVGQSLPDEMLVDEGVRKVALRQMADGPRSGGSGPPTEKAAQYGSGIHEGDEGHGQESAVVLDGWTVKVIAEEGGSGMTLQHDEAISWLYSVESMGINWAWRG